MSKGGGLVLFQLLGLPIEQYSDMMNIFGLLALLALVLTTVSSLPMVRRASYNLFRSLHALFPLIFVISACLHSINVFILIFPAICIYILDCSIRIYLLMTGNIPLIISKDGDFIRILAIKECTDMGASGKFYDIRVNEVSLFSHPLSIATVTEKGLVFLAKQSPRYGSWTSRLAILIEDGPYHTTGSLAGPFKGPIDLETYAKAPLSKLVCIAGGSGLTALAILINEFAKLRPSIPIIIYWSCRGPPPGYIIQDLLAINVSIIIHNTGTSKIECEGVKVIHGRMRGKQIVLRMMEGEGIVGIATCGPSSMMDEVEDGIIMYPSRVVFGRESYNW